MCRNAIASSIIQSIPSPNAEPFKQWLAQVGSEILDEIADPEIAIERAVATYREKGYSEEWITQRLRGIDNEINEIFNDSSEMRYSPLYLKIAIMLK